MARHACRFGVVLMSALMLATSFSHIAAPPAQATVHSIVTANSNEDPEDQFVTGEDIWAFLRVDFGGGIICAKPAADYGADLPGCGGVGTSVGFIDGPAVPIVLGGLAPGRYILVGDSGPGNRIASNEFFVSVCVGPDCRRIIEASYANRKSEGFRILAQSMKTSCQLFELADNVGTLVDAWEAGQAITSLVFAADGGYFASAELDKGLAASVKVVIKNLLKDQFFSSDFAVSLFTGEACKLAESAADQAGDPPDYNYLTVAQPAIAPLPATDDPTADLVVADQAETDAYIVAMLHAYERYQGALERGDAAATHLQLGALATFGRHLENRLPNVSADLRSYASGLPGDSFLLHPSLESEDQRTAIQAVRTRIATDGFTADELATFATAGVPDKMIPFFRAQMGSSIADLPLGQSPKDALLATADGFDALLPELDPFVRNAEVAAANTDQAPVATFTAVPSSGDAPLEVTFTSTSTDADGDALTTSWDFGDGSPTGSGSPVNHTYASGTYTATLTVSDGSLSDSLSTSISASGNQPPVAVDDSLETVQGTPASVSVLTNDTDPDSDVLSVSGSTNGVNGSVSCTTAGSCTYTPAAGFNGSDSFTYTVSDGHGHSDTGTVFVTVDPPPVNHPPVAADYIVAGVQDTPATLDVLLNSSDPDGDAIHVKAVSAPAHGSVLCASTGFCTYTPVTGYFGADSFTYTIADGKGGEDTGEVDITLAQADPTDQPPVAGDDDVTVKSNLSAFPYLLNNDSDPDGDALAIVAHSDAAHGTVDCLSYGFCTYTPDHDYSGPDSFQYTVSDGRGRTDTATVSITVLPNDPPVAVDDLLVLPLNKSRSISVTGNDSDPNSDELTATLSTDPAHGSAGCGGSSCTYTPDLDYVGPDSFDYTLSDGRGGTDVGTVTVTVEANHPPVAQDDHIATFVGTKTNWNVIVNDSDPDDDPLTFNGNTPPAHGTAECSATGLCVYIPAAGYIGSDSFTYTISDGVGGTDTGTVDVTIGPSPVVLRTQSEVNAAVAKGVDYIDAQQNSDGSFGTGFPIAETSTSILAYSVLDRGDINNLDPDKQAHLRSAITWLIGQQNPATGAWDGLQTYYTGLAVTALSSAEGIDPAIPASIAAGRGWLIANQTAPPSVTGNPITPDCSSADDSPTAGYCGGWNYDGDGGQRSDESNTGFALTGLSATGGVPAAAAEINVGWQHHVQELDTNPFARRNDGGGDYEPGVSFGGFSSNANDTGSLIFGYAYDGVSSSNPQAAAAITFGLNVLDEYQIAKVSARAMINHSGQEQDGICELNNPACDWTIAGDGGFHYSLWALTKGLGHYIPANLSDKTNWYASVADLLLMDQANDGSWPQDGRDDGTQIFATGLAVDALGRVGAPHTLTISKDGTGGGSVSSTPTGIDCGATCAHDFSDGSSVVLSATADAGSVFTGWAGAGCSGTADCTVKMNASKDVTATFDLSNTPPIGTADSYSIAHDTTLTVPALTGVLANDTDADGDALTATKVADPTHGSVVLAADGSFVYTPAAAYIGADSFTYDVSDGSAVVGPVTVSITVTPTNHAPVGVADSYSGPQDAVLTVPVLTGVLANDTDADGDSLTAAKVTDSSHGSVTLNASGSFTYTPNAGYVGPDSFTYTASDGTATSAATTVSITISKINHAPTLGAIADQTIPEMVAFSLTLAGSDSDADTLAYSVTTGPTGLTVNPTTGVLSWTPTEAQGPGSYPVTVKVADPDGLFAIRSFTIAVTEVNRDPVLAAIADQTVNPGDAVTAKASATDPDLPANTLVYSLTSGPVGATVNATTGAFAWTASSTLGDYPVTITVSDGAGGSASRSFTIRVVRDDTALTLGGDTAGQYSDKATISATLKAGSTPLADQSVSISLGTASQTVTTNASGVASATFTIPGPAGSLATGASFVGTPAYAPSSAAGTFTVNREDSTIVYSGDTIGLAGATLHLSATFTDSAAAGYAGPNPETGASVTIGDITKARIAFAVYNAATCLTGNPIITLSAFVTDTGTAGDGIGTATVTWSSLSEGSFCIVPSLVGAAGTGSNGYYTAPPAEPAGLAVFIDTAGKVTGGGWVAIADGRGNFGFNATSNGSKVKGNLVFIERTTYQGKKAMLIIKSNAIDNLRTSGFVFPISASLTGKASFKYISSVDGSVLFESGNATFTATVVDTNAKGGAGDTFAIRVLDKTGAVLADLGTTPLGAGNIVAHLK